MPESITPAFLLLAMLPASAASVDLSRYRNFQLGTELSTVARQAELNPRQAEVIHSRPALIQELKWRPQSLGPATRTETAQDVVFSFYDGKLFQIVINYDRYETEGMTAQDVVEAISMTYGPATMPPENARTPIGPYGEKEEVLSQWQDDLYCFDLIRSASGPTYKLVGVIKKLDGPARAAIAEALRLDDQEAPQRNAARAATEDAAARDKLEKARLVNKPRFRP